jgi:hypothetical protein
MGSRLYPRAIQPGHDASKITKQTTIHNFLLHILFLPFDNPNPVPLDQVYLMLEQLGFQIGCAGGKRTCDITTYFSQESPCDFPGKTKPCYRHAKWAFQRYLMEIRTARSGEGPPLHLWSCSTLVLSISAKRQKSAVQASWCSCFKSRCFWAASTRAW